MTRGIAAVVTAALILTAVVYSHRISSTADGFTINGDYDTYDSLFYAAISSELAHRVPPDAPYAAGHELNYSFYPHLFLGLVHKFGAVPLLPMFLGWGWGLFMVLIALSTYVFVARATTTRVAVVAVLLLLVGSDMSYLLAPFYDPTTTEWDPVIWSLNLFSPGPSTLFFNTFAPTLVLVIGTLLVLTTSVTTGRSAGTILAGALVAMLLQFKPFSYAVVLAALAAAGTFAASRDERRRYLAVLAGGIVLAVPHYVRILRLYGESHAQLTLEPFLMQRLLAGRLEFEGSLVEFFLGLGAPGWVSDLGIAIVAFVPFLLLGWGYRLLAIGALIRALTNRGLAPFHLLAWIVLAGLVVPLVIATEPYYQTIHFYQLTLFLLPIFVALTLARIPGRRGMAATAVAFALALPSTANYLWRKWHDDARPMVAASRSVQDVAQWMHHLDRESTVLLHAGPREPSPYVILGARRSLLSWSEYAAGSDRLRDEIAHFFRREPGDPMRARRLLAAYPVTHVIDDETRGGLHPEIRAQLQPVFRRAEITVYEVPDALRGE